MADPRPADEDRSYEHHGMSRAGEPAAGARPRRGGEDEEARRLAEQLAGGRIDGGVVLHG